MADIIGTNGNDTLATLTGTAAADLIYPFLGDDMIDGLGGIDKIILDYGLTINAQGRWYITAGNTSGTTGTVGQGPNLFNYSARASFVNVESIQLAAAGLLIVDGNLMTGAGSLALTGNGDTDHLELSLRTFTAGVNFTINAGNVVLPNGTFTSFENYTVYFGTGNDIANGGDARDVFLGLGGNDTLNGNGGADSLWGYDNDDTINGGEGDDQLYGGAGVDVLNGGNGNDDMYGHDQVSPDTTAAADQLFGGEGNDRMVGGYGDTISGGAGYDILTLDLSAGTVGVTLDLSAMFAGGSAANGGGTISGFEAWTTIAGTAGGDTITIGAAGVRDPNGLAAYSAFPGAISGLGGNDIISGGTGVDFIYGGEGNDTITGHDGDDNLQGEGGNDTINGSGGDDQIQGGLGLNKLFGGTGNDRIDGGSAADELYGEDGDDILQANGGGDTMVGGAGNDQIYGGPGAGAGDRLYGGTGDDIYYNVGASTLVFESAGEGIDKIIPSGSVYLPANIEILDLTQAFGNFYGVGNELDNLINGSFGANLLIAGAGNDTVNGGGGNDILYGQDGTDTINGDDGVDYVAAGIGNDVVNGGNGSDEIWGEAGDDTLTGGASFDFDILVGGDGNDTLRGDSLQGDFDYLYGNLGDDSFYVDTPFDLEFEQAGEGTDTVFADIVGAGFYLHDNVENLTLLGQTPFGVGNASNNTLTGNAIGNYLLGGAGDDILNGKQGGDVLFGEAGADTFVFEAGTGGDIIGDFAAGTDKIKLTGIFATFAEAQANFIQNGNVGAINLGGGDFIVLHNVTMSQLIATDFVFG